MTGTKVALVLLVFIATVTLAAPAQTQVFVSGQTNGGFGAPIDMTVPYVPAAVVTGPATITITYINGTVIDAGGVDTGPDGTFWNCGTAQSPLEESRGVAGGKISDLDALIGVFVPAARANHPKFTAIDGTKDATHVGIPPGDLFFVGEAKTIVVNEAGTLFLGINDWWMGDNSGGFNVELTVQ